MNGMTARERRSEPRFLCADLVRVRIGAPADGTAAVANLEDISPSGACLHLDRAVRPGVDLEIDCSNCRLRGRVRYCRFVEIGWNVGVEFETTRAWNRERYEPAHLLDVERWGAAAAVHFGGAATRS